MRGKYYYCKHCRRRHPSYAMAEICYALDKKIEAYERRQEEKLRDKSVDK